MQRKKLETGPVIAVMKRGSPRQPKSRGCGKRSPPSALSRIKTRERDVVEALKLLSNVLLYGYAILGWMLTMKWTLQAMVATENRRLRRALPPSEKGDNHG